MNGFIKKSVGTLTLGEKLKKIRSERRISLGEVSRVTKIQIKYLEYLEEGKFDKLPVDVYVRGFLKSYAEFLAVDENVLLKLYEKEKGIKKNLDKRKNKKPLDKKPKPINISSFVFTPKIIATGLAVIIFLAGAFYIYRELGAFASAPRLVVLNPQQNATVNGNTVSVEGVTDKDAQLFINSQPILVNDEGKFQEDLTLQSGENTIDVEAVNRFGKKVSQSFAVQSNYHDNANKAGANDGNNSASNSGTNPENNLNGQNNASGPPAGSSGANSSADQRSGSDAGKTTTSAGIEIEVTVNPGPVWLSVEADGNSVFSGTMLSGAMQTFSAQNKLIINSGKADATFIKFNGKDLGALGSGAGPVRDVTFTKDTKF